MLRRVSSMPASFFRAGVRRVIDDNKRERWWSCARIARTVIPSTAPISIMTTVASTSAPAPFPAARRSRFGPRVRAGSVSGWSVPLDLDERRITAVAHEHERRDPTGRPKSAGRRARRGSTCQMDAALSSATVVSSTLTSCPSSRKSWRSTSGAGRLQCPSTVLTHDLRGSPLRGFLSPPGSDDLG